MSGAAWLVLSAALGTGPRWMDLPAPEQRPALEASMRLPLPERILTLSQGFLGTPYVVSPLGEGPGRPPDADPTFRLDAVDCQTFVEEVLAFSLALPGEDPLELLQQIRYRGAGRTYPDRNHLMEAQWLPDNVRRGFLRDVTAELAGPMAARAEKRLTLATWNSASGRALALLETQRPVGAFGLTVVPLAQAGAVAGRAPSGTLALVVREDRPNKVTRITHLGFLVQREGKTFLRHAARNIWAKVVDEELASFLARNGRYHAWPVIGLAFYEPMARQAP